MIIPAESPASVHLVKIRSDSKTHYHKRQTEVYVVLEGVGQIELDGTLFPIKPLTAKPASELSNWLYGKKPRRCSDGARYRETVQPWAGWHAKTNP